MQGSTRKGKAAEHLVCFDLLSRGYEATLTSQAFGYDVILDSGKSLYRIQVKSATKPRNGVYSFWNRHSHYNKGYENKRYELGSFDLLALVATDIRKIAYLDVRGRQPSQIVIRHPDIEKIRKGNEFHNLTLERALNE